MVVVVVVVEAVLLLLLLLLVVIVVIVVVTPATVVVELHKSWFIALIFKMAFVASTPFETSFVCGSTFFGLPRRPWV